MVSSWTAPSRRSIAGTPPAAALSADEPPAARSVISRTIVGRTGTISGA